MRGLITLNRGKGLLVALAIGTAALFATGGGASAEGGTAELLQALRQGGHVIYIRHPRTNWDETDERDRPNWWRHCGEGHRDLSDEGRQDARLIGDAIRTLEVPVGKVLSSEYCRAVETAKLAFGEGNFTTEFDITGVGAFMTVDPENGGPRLIEATRRRLAEVPEPGKNIVLISHIHKEPGPVAEKVFSEIVEGEAAVFRPDGNGAYTLAGRLKVEDWAALLEAGKN
ncbi:MAG TPA: histidine phosphatase family protein [Arenibaculum sp.]|nr:histidine phosphatase family protein [Arenibaculum sp.]